MRCDTVMCCTSRRRCRASSFAKVEQGVQIAANRNQKVRCRPISEGTEYHAHVPFMFIIVASNILSGIRWDLRSKIHIQSSKDTIGAAGYRSKEKNMERGGVYIQEKSGGGGEV